MKNVFIIFGYGIPKDIIKDENYNFYLKMAFNRLYDLALENSQKSLIIACGGKTDFFKPYQRTEGQIIVNWFKKFIDQRSYLKNITKHWQLLAEKKSISTLENLLYSYKILKKLKINQAKVFIFCEQTRGRRIKILAKKIFKNYSLQVVPIDFDVSETRYLPVDYLHKKENRELKYSLWALKNPQNFQKHHRIYEEKFKYLRQIPHQKQMLALRKWWDEKAKNNELFQ